MDDDRLLEALDEAECRLLLATARLGRLGFTDGALPAIVPVPFVLEHDRIVIPAFRGEGVLSAVRRSVVAFAVDSVDVDAGTGWAVTVVGPSRVLRQGGPVSDGDGDGRRGEGAGRCSVVVHLGLVTGWRLSLPPDAAPGVAIGRAWAGG